MTRRILESAAPVVAVLVFSTLAIPEPVSAQGRPGGGPPADLTVVPVDVAFPMPDQFSFNAGFVDHGGVTVTVEPKNKNRQNWQLFVQASAADMGGYGKPVQDVLVRAQGSPTWIPLTTTAQLIAEGTGTSTITIYYRLLLDWALDAPGTYSVPLEYYSTSF